MRGTILGVHDGRGVLLGADERRLEFPLTEWRSGGAPMAGQSVDFVEEGGQARAVFAVSGAFSASGGGARHSGSFVLGAISVGCLALGFIIPLLPTVAAFVLGVIGASQARAEQDETALLLSRIGWIGGLVVLTLAVLVLIVVFAFIGTIGVTALTHSG